MYYWSLNLTSKVKEHIRLWNLPMEPTKLMPDLAVEISTKNVRWKEIERKKKGITEENGRENK